MAKQGLLERLQAGQDVICGEGYLFELERRGYLTAGEFVPEVALDNPEVLKQVYRDFVRAGSDTIEAFTYNGHREKMRIIGKEDLLEPLNRAALRLAKEVADEFPDLDPMVAGNISNTNIFDPDDPDSKEQIRAMFDEMCAWAKAEGVDYIVGETFYYHEEAEIALESIKKTGLPAVITLGLMAENKMRDGITVEESCKKLADAGADVVGMNCFRGPATMTPYLKKICATVKNAHIAALPVPYRTTEQQPTFFNLDDPGCPCCVPDNRTFPTALDPLLCNRYEVEEFTKQAKEMGITYFGLCCGAAPHTLRAMAETLGRTPPASRYSPNMTKHFMYGTDESLKGHVTGYGKSA